jgi:peptide/nickel transport system substrate-binding protein
MLALAFMLALALSVNPGRAATYQPYSQAAVPLTQYFQIDPNDGQVDAHWSSQPLVNDAASDSGDGGPGYDLLKGWAAANSEQATAYSFRVSLAATAVVSETVISARLDCNHNGDFDDSVDVYVDYDMTIDRVNIISGDLLKDYYADHPYGEQIGADIEWMAPTDIDPHSPSIWAACSPATANVIFEALDSNYHLKDITTSSKFFPSPALNIGLATEPGGLDPSSSMDATTFLVATQVYDTLTRYRPGDSVPVPALAQSWSVSADQLTWTFNLRPGVAFHDGAPLDSAAVLFNFNRWWDPAHPNHNADFPWFQAFFGGYKGEPGCLVSDLRAPMATQFVMELSSPLGILPSLLAFPAFSVASPATIQSGAVITAPIGSGPFGFLGWNPGVQIALEDEATYWGGAPQPNGLSFQFIPAHEARFAAVLSNTLQAAYDLPHSYALTATQHSELGVQWGLPNQTGYLGINRGHTPLDNLLVRQAIAHAIRKPELVEALYGAGYLLADQFVPPGTLGHSPVVQQYEYNPALAMSLLSQAGYPQGFATTLAYRDVLRDYLPRPLETAQALGADLQAVGINATVVEYPSGTFINKWRAGELDLYLLGWIADYPHADNYFNFSLCDPANLGFGPLDATLCSQVNAARQETDLALQQSMSEANSAWVMETLPMVPLAHAQRLVVSRREVAGLALTPLPVERFSAVFYASDWLYLPFLLR